MAIPIQALNAYNAAIKLGSEQTKKKSLPGKGEDISKSFTSSLTDSLKNVNNMQNQAVSMAKEFATGERQNVHELMISLQKAGIAVSMTSTVRNKVMEAYKELMHMQF